MKTVTIDVTQADITAGESANCTLCPIALASQRALGTQYVTVGECMIGVYDDRWKFIRCHRVPYEARRFIRAFDAGRPVEPISFEAE